MRRQHIRHAILAIAAILSGCLLLPTCVMAQNDTLVSNYVKTRSYQIGLGGTDILDTYLSRQKATGTGLTGLIISEQQKAGSRWSNIWQHQLHISFNSDRNGNSTFLEATYNLYWGRYYSWQFMGDRIRLQAGPTAMLGLGVLNNSRSNSNNPAQARVSLNIMPSAVATWKFPLFRRQWALRYEAELPLVGIMFSPNYGQSYFEMFGRGNNDHNIVPTTFVSSPTFRQQLTLRCNLGRKCTLSLGYLGDYQQAQVNNLKQHVIYHSVMLGFVKRFQLIHYRP